MCGDLPHAGADAVEQAHQPERVESRDGRGAAFLYGAEKGGGLAGAGVVAGAAEVGLEGRAAAHAPQAEAPRPSRLSTRSG
jgi:hypothetical protein